MNKLFLLSVLLLGTVFGLSGRVGTASSDFQDISVTLNAAKYNLSVQTSASGGVWTYGFQEPQDTFSINFSQSGYYPVSFSFGNVSSSRTGLVTYTSATPDNNTYIFINGQGELASTEAYGPDGCVFYRGSNSNFCIGISVYFVTRNNDYYFYINPTYLKHGKYRFATLNSTNANLAMQFFSKSTGHIPFYRREASTVDAQKPQLWSALDFLHCSWGALVLPVQEIGSAPNNSQWWQYNECLYQPVNISGYVGQANQAPVAGVSITFTDSTGYLKPFTVTTGSDGYYYAQTRTTVFNVVAVKAGYTTYSAARNVTMAGNYVGFPMNPAPATTGPATTGPATTGPATTGPATTGPATTGPATTGPATTGPATTGPATTGPATTGPATTGPATTGPATTGPATTGPATTGPATTGPATTGSATTGESATTGTPATTADSSTTGTTGSINTTTTGQQPVTTTSTTGQSTVVVKVSVNVTVFTFVITNYEEQSFKTNLAAQLNVPKEWIVIVSIAKRQSSVKFYIASNTASSSDDVQTEINKSIEAANELEKILADPALKASLETALGTNVTSSATETETVTVDVTVPSGTTTGPVVDSSATVSVVSFIFVVIMFILVIA